jgi:hypothetical protein
MFGNYEENDLVREVRKARAVKTVGGFAAAGFLLPLLLLAYYSVANYMGKFPNTDLLFDLCPTSIMSMALDKASTSTAVVVWLIIAASNAVLYAVPGIAVALILYFRKTNRSTL